MYSHYSKHEGVLEMKLIPYQYTPSVYDIKNYVETILF